MHAVRNSLVHALSLLLLLPAVGASAQGIPDFDNSLVYTNGGHVVICPRGDAPSLADAGILVEIHLRDNFDLPIANFPYQDIWLDDAGTGDISLCQAGSLADFNTDALGYTTITGSIAGGGWTLSGMSAYAAALLITKGDGPVIDIRVNSPDLDGTLIVNIADVAPFAADYISGAYQFRSDFVDQGPSAGRIDLADVGQFAAHLGHACP